MTTMSDLDQNDGQIKEFLTDLLYEAGFTEEEDNIPMLLNDLEPIFLDNITSQLVGFLSEDHRENARNLLESDKFDEFFIYCKTHIEDYEVAFDEALELFAKEYLDNFGE